MSEVGMVGLAGVLFVAALFMYLMARLRHRHIRKDMARSEDYMNKALGHYMDTSKLLREWGEKHEERLDA